MGYLFLGTSAVLSYVAYLHWYRLFEEWWTKREERAEEFADQTRDDILGLIDFFPRKLRRVLHPLSFWVVTLFLGGFHFLVIRHAFPGEFSLGAWLPLHYLWTLALWLALLAFPAFLTAQDRAAVRVQRRKAAADPPAQ